MISAIVITALLTAACNKPNTNSNSIKGTESITISQDLGLSSGETVVIDLTQTDVKQPGMGPREQATILTENDGVFTLRYVFRFPQSRNPNFSKWDLWVNHEIIGDGTGAEIPAMKEYSKRPSSEQSNRSPEPL
ncbi:hypothetical protein [Rhodopirellula bahusiensis]|uniref:hypothetical protein n=1 Tax=Rhodopirellula bahusiensis TaxID=2014065 RepID=UPI003265EED7